MAQMGFFDLSDRYASLDAKKDPLLEIDSIVPWDDFRPVLKKVWRKPLKDRKSHAGRKPWDEIIMFKALVLSALYNLSDDQIEFQVRDRLSFMRFLGLGLEDRVPDAKTVWAYREELVKAKKFEELFALFDGHLARQGYIARGGQILDASIVPVPRNHNTREENETIKSGEVPEDWMNKPNMRAQKDTDARWTKKHGRSYYGYKNHVNADRKYKLIRRYQVTDASVHDSQVIDDILTSANTAKGVWADSAYRSAETEKKLQDQKLCSKIHRKAQRNKPLTKNEKKGNSTKSRIRARIEHVFGAQSNDMGGVLVRTIGKARAEVKIGLKNLAYNMRRLGQLRRLHPSPI